MHINGPHQFCKTFAGVGLVAKEAVGVNGKLGFAITKRGIQLGRPLVGHLLDISLDNDSVDRITVRRHIQLLLAVGKLAAVDTVQGTKYFEVKSSS